MRQSFTAVLERNRTIDGELVTEPYEVAWAGEARWFVRVLDAAGADPRLTLRTQTSPDGLHWCDLDGADQVVDAGAGELHTWSAREFGGWLRVRGAVAEGSTLTVLVYLALKS